MPALVSSSPQLLLLKARQKLGMTQKEFSDAVGSSVRTVARWESATAAPSPWHYRKLAALLGPLDRELARDAATLSGEAIEEAAAPARSPQASASPGSPPAAAPMAPVPMHILVDALMFAAARELGASAPTFDGVRAALRAAFAHARDLRLDPADVVDALSPPPAPSAKAARAGKVTSGQ